MYIIHHDWDLCQIKKKYMTISNCSLLSVGLKSKKCNQRPSLRINITGLSIGDTYLLPLSRTLGLPGV